MYHSHGKLLMPFAEGVCRWVRFGKRTHRRGVFERDLPERGKRFAIMGGRARRFTSGSVGRLRFLDKFGITPSEW